MLTPRMNHYNDSDCPNFETGILFLKTPRTETFLPIIVLCIGFNSHALQIRHNPTSMCFNGLDPKLKWIESVCQTKSQGIMLTFGKQTLGSGLNITVP